MHQISQAEVMYCDYRTIMMPIYSYVLVGKSNVKYCLRPQVMLMY